MGAEKTTLTAEQEEAIHTISNLIAKPGSSQREEYKNLQSKFCLLRQIDQKIQELFEIYTDHGQREQIETVAECIVTNNIKKLLDFFKQEIEDRRAAPEESLSKKVLKGEFTLINAQEAFSEEAIKQAGLEVEVNTPSDSQQSQNDERGEGASSQGKSPISQFWGRSVTQTKSPTQLTP